MKKSNYVCKKCVVAQFSLILIPLVGATIISFSVFFKCLFICQIKKNIIYLDLFLLVCVPVR